MSHSAPMSTGNGPADATGLDLDLSGRQLGDYRLLRRLGRGAMADVYLAEQGSLRRQVAFKVLKRELAADELYVRRFHGEAQAAAALVHANIVQIYEVGNIEGIHYIAQEYVEGQNLSQLIARHGPPDIRLALAVMRQVTAALCKAAERGIVHRDIKPENIMLGRSGEVKVADFGLARITAGDDTVKLTQVGITMGTPLYMSPEQVENRPLDSRSDLYSLGVTCFHMLAGQPPFRGDTALSVALQHVRTQPERLENLRPDLPPALSRIIHQLLVKDPAERFSTPRELLKELRSLQIDGIEQSWPAEMDEVNGTEIASLLALRGEATQRLQNLMKTQSLATRGKRRRMGYAAALVIGAMLLGAGAAWATRERYLLDVPAAELPKVAVQKTAEEQYYLAEYSNTLAAWNAVVENFPTETRWVWRAKEELVKIFLPTDMKLAKPLLDELAEATDSSRQWENQFRAFSAAGLAFYYAFSREKNPEQSAKQLDQLRSLAGGLNPSKVQRVLEDRQMEQLVYAVIQLNRQTTDENKKDWDNWLNQMREENETPVGEAR
ncbi:MAG: serine/threonine protein kinase [Pirellulales bacterium]|nr:serine/threonine protein kinase [Pirellulales bacterium]